YLSYTTTSHSYNYPLSLHDALPISGVTYDHIYSSSVIEPKSFRKGVETEIVTPDNITKVTEEQYTNAAISAGIQNAKIRVASTIDRKSTRLNYSHVSISYAVFCLKK